MQKDSLNDKLFDDLLQRSKSAAFHFVVGAIVLLNWSLDKKLVHIQNPLLYGVIFFSLFRLVISIILTRNKIKNKWLKRLIGLSVSANALCWASVFGLTFWANHNFSTSHTMAFMFVSFYTSASIVTLSSFLTYAFLFQLSNFLPLIIFSLRDIYILELKSIIPIMIAQSFALMYLIVQSLNYNKQLKQKYLNEIELVELNEKLQKSKDDLISETLKVQHASRLASLGEMAGGIAHEINNPLAVILGALQSIKVHLLKNKFDLEFINNKIEKSENAINRVTKIISGLKKFSRQEPQTTFEKFDLKETVDETLGFCLEKFKAHFINFEKDEIPSILISGSSLQLSQVILNLLNNAFDAVSVLPKYEEKKVGLRFEKSENSVIISIYNTGPKIPIEYQDKLFEPFFTTKTVGKGTGLGLSISKGLIENHHGRIWYDKEALETTFRIFLPISN